MAFSGAQQNPPRQKLQCKLEGKFQIDHVTSSEGVICNWYTTSIASIKTLIHEQNYQIIDVTVVIGPVSFPSAKVQ